MKKIQDVSAFVFISCVGVLAAISILGIWKVLNQDVINKSIQTISLLAVVTVIIIVAGKFFDKNEEQSAEGVPMVPVANPAFSSLRHFTVVTLIGSVTILALLGVLAIWDVLAGEALSKSLSSMSILAFASLVVVMTCLQRENHKLMKAKVSGWAIFGLVILGWMLLGVLSNSF